MSRLGLTTCAATSGWPGQILVSGILIDACLGFGLAAAFNAIIESVPITQTGEAISANTIARTVGSSVGTAVIAALISSHTRLFTLPTGKIALRSDHTFVIGFWACAGLAALAIVIALAAPSLKNRMAATKKLGVADTDSIVVVK